MYIEENTKNEMKDLLERIEKMEREEKIYSNDEGIKRNKEKFEEKYNQIKEKMLEEYDEIIEETKQQYQENVKKLKENIEVQRNELQTELYRKVYEYDQRLERLENEKKNYSKDSEAVQTIENNISKIENEMQKMINEEERKISEIMLQKENDINTKIDDVKSKVLEKTNQAKEELAQIGIQVPQVDLESKVKEKKNKEDIEKNKTISEDKTKNEAETETEKETGKETEKAEHDENKENKNTENAEPTSEKATTYTKTSASQDAKTDKIKIKYSARFDSYVITNQNRQKIKLYRNELKPIDKEQLAQKLNIDIEQLQNLDTNVLSLLLNYDKRNGTMEAIKYKDTVIKEQLSKRQMKKEMKKAQISIKYDLKGLYKRNSITMMNKYSKEEKQELLDNANKAKQAGIGATSKGIAVTIMETYNKVKDTIAMKKSLPNAKKIKFLGKPKEETKQEKYDKLVNKEYMQSLDEDFEKNKKDFKNKFKINIDLGKRKEIQQLIKENNEVKKEKEDEEETL